MIRVYAEAFFMALVALSIIVSCVHSFSVSEEARADDISINRYGED